MTNPFPPFHPMLLRVPPHLNVHHHFLCRRHHLTAAASPPSFADLWIAKIISTVFLLSPSAAAAQSLEPFASAVEDPVVSLAAVRRLPDPHSALRLFTLARSAFGVDHHPLAFRFLIGLLCRAGVHDHALKVFDEMLDQAKCVDLFCFEVLCHSCVDAGKAELAVAMLRRASELDYRVRRLTFNKLLALLVSRNRIDEAAVLFRECSSLQVFAPDTWSFNIVINGFCRNGEFDAAFELVEEMDSFGCCPDAVTHNTIIGGMCRADQVDRVCEYFHRIQQAGAFVPDLRTCTSVISCCCKMGKMDAAFQFFSEMMSMGMKPSNVTFNVLIDGYGKAGNMPAALSMYDRMLVNGCSPDVVTFTSLIDGYCRNEQLVEAMNLWDEMSRRDIRPNVYSFSVVISFLCKKNRLQEARNKLNEMNLRRDINPRAFVYNPVIDGLCKAGNVDDANLVITEMEGRGCFPDKITYTILIIGHCMKGRMAEAIILFHRMVVSGFVPDSVVVGSLVSCLLKAGMPNEVNRVMHIASGKVIEVPQSSAKRQGISVAV